jgi:hypothetical protein
MLALYFLKPVSNDSSQRGQPRRLARCDGGGDKPLAKAIFCEVLLKPLKIGKGARLLLFVCHCPISQNARGIGGAW